MSVNEKVSKKKSVVSWMKNVISLLTQDVQMAGIKEFAHEKGVSALVWHALNEGVNVFLKHYEALKKNNLKAEFVEIWPDVAKMENHVNRAGTFSVEELTRFNENSDRVRDILAQVFNISAEKCTEEGRLTEVQRSFGNKLFAQEQLRFEKV